MQITESSAVSAGQAAPDTFTRVFGLIAHWAERIPGALALKDPVIELTYSALRSAVERTSDVLACQGVRSGDRLMIVSENSVAATVLALGAQHLDAWPAIVNARIAAREISAMADRIEPRCVLYATGQSSAARKHADSDRVSPLQGFPVSDDVMVGDLAESRREPSFESADQQVGLLIFTSGTTGLPKAVMHSHRGLINLGRVLARSRRTEAGDQYTGAGPLSHIMGVANLMNVLWAGASLNLLPRLELPRLVESIISGSMTHLSFVPTAYSRLLDFLEREGISLEGHGLRYISAGGAVLDPALKERVESVFGMPLVNGYGMTECAPVARTEPDREIVPGSIGWPEEGVETRIVAADDRDVADQPGELWLRSPTAMLGYYRDPAHTEAAFREGGWLATGDLARYHADGQIEIVGRKKEMIIRSGFNVYPAEVEQAINRLGGVIQSAVAGRRDHEGNEEVIAFVQPVAGSAITVADIQAALVERIAPYKRPGEIHLVSEMPLGATGKIKKDELLMRWVSR